MTRFGPVWISVLVAFCVSLSSCTGCNRDVWIPETEADKGPSKIDLLEFQRQRAMELDSLMSAVSSDWETPIQTGTGLRLEVLDSVPDSNAVRDLPEGRVLEEGDSIGLAQRALLTEPP